MNDQCEGYFRRVGPYFFLPGASPVVELIACLPLLNAGGASVGRADGMLINTFTLCSSQVCCSFPINARLVT